jgi:hypothetical protein
MIGWLRNGELKRICKEAVAAYFKALSRHLPGGTEENNENHSRDSWSPGRDINPEPPEYETGMITTRPRRSVQSIK